MKSFRRDIELYVEAKNSSKIKIFLDINIWIVLTYRISNFFYTKGFFLVSKFFWLWNRIVFSVDIDPGANLGPGLRLVHPVGIVIGRNVSSEGDLCVYQNVTIGGSNNKKKTHNGVEIEQPYFGKNVKIYASSVVVGPIVIGENVTIAANATIYKDIDNDSLAYSNNKSKNKRIGK